MYTVYLHQTSKEGSEVIQGRLLPAKVLVSYAFVAISKARTLRGRMTEIGAVHDPIRELDIETDGVVTRYQYNALSRGMFEKFCEHLGVDLQHSQTFLTFEPLAGSEIEWPGYAK